MHFKHKKKIHDGLYLFVLLKTNLQDSLISNISGRSPQIILIVCLPTDFQEKIN